MLEATTVPRRRMADEQLILLQQRLDNHIEEYQRRCQREDRRWDKMLEVQERNTRGIEELTKSTQGMVEAWNAAGGAIKVGAAFGRFIKWCSGIAILGTCIAWVVQHFKG